MTISHLAAAIGLTMIAGVALGQSPSLATASSGLVAGDATEAAGLQSIAKGSVIMGPFWIRLDADSPTRNDDVPKIINHARPMTKTASR